VEEAYQDDIKRLIMGIKITKLQLILIGVLLCMFLAMNIYYTIKINSINDINQ